MIDIIIPTCKTELSKLALTKCLTSICKYTNKEDYKLYIVENDFEGFAKAVNDGIKRTSGENDIVILNDDVEVVPEWLDKLKEKAKEPLVGMVADELGYRKNHAAFYCTYIKREVINKVGLLDERFKYGEWEDIDYGIRTRLAGYKIAVAEFKVLHYLHTTLGQLTDEQKKEQQKNKELFLEKYKGTNIEAYFIKADNVWKELEDTKFTRLNLGCGRIIYHGCINIDTINYPGVDVVHNLEHGLPFDKINEFAKTEIKGTIQEVRCIHVLEHIHNFIKLMYDIYNICENKAIIFIKVPPAILDDGLCFEGAFRDPTHVRYFTKRSFDYFDKTKFESTLYNWPMNFKVLKSIIVQEGEDPELYVELEVVK